MNKETKKIRDELAKAQMIYEPKWGGKDHSGYDTLMKYEINYERAECFELGFDSGHATAMKDVGELVDAVKRCTQSQEWDGKSIDVMALGINLILNKALSRFTQNQTEKIEGE
jgi:hypothetical protein